MFGSSVRKTIDLAKPQEPTTKRETTADYWTYDHESGYMNIEVESVLSDLKHNDWKTRQKAADFITRLEPGQSTLRFRTGIPDLINCLNSEHEPLKQAAGNCIARIAADATVNQGIKLPELEPAIEVLSGLVRARDTSTRFWSVIAIGTVAANIGPDAMRNVVPLLIEATNDADSSVSEYAIGGLGQFGREARSAVPVLVGLLEDGGSKTNVAATALGEIACDAELCVPALIRALRKESDADTKLNIVRALAQFGPHAKDSVPLLIPLLNRVIPVISKFDQQAQWTAAFAIAQIGPAGVEAISALEEAFNNVRKDNQNEWDRNVQLSTFAALCAVGPEGKLRAVELSQDLREFTIRGEGWLLNNPLEVWSVVAKAPNLSRLDLDGSGFTDSHLEPLSSMDQLTDLLLPMTTTDSGLRHIAGLTNANMESLRIGRPVTNEELTFLLHQEKQVQQPITDDGLKHLIRMHELRILSIPFADLTDAGLQNLQFLSLIETLHIGGKKVTDKGLSHLSHLKRLKELSLRGTGISDYGVMTIAKNHSTLQALDLSHCNITAACVDDLSKLKQLRLLRVTSTPLAGGRTKSDSVLALHKALPSCKIQYDN